jgi:hypothetical protein
MVRTYTGATVREADAASMKDLSAVRKDGYEVHSRSRSGTEVTVTYRRRGGTLRGRAVLVVELVAAVVAAIILAAFVLAMIIGLMGWWSEISSSAYSNLVILLAIAFWLALAFAAAAVAGHGQTEEHDATQRTGQKTRDIPEFLIAALGGAIVVASSVTVTGLMWGFQFGEVHDTAAMWIAGMWALAYALWRFRAADRARRGGAANPRGAD